MLGGLSNEVCSFAPGTDQNASSSAFPGELDRTQLAQYEKGGSEDPEQDFKLPLLANYREPKVRGEQMKTLHQQILKTQSGQGRWLSR